jgi:hypothetical protein
MKGPGWKIYIALFILIILVVAFRYTEGFNSYNKKLSNSSADYYSLDSSYNDTLYNNKEFTKDASFNDLKDTQLDNTTFRKTDITAGWDFFLFK